MRSSFSAAIIAGIVAIIVTLAVIHFTTPHGAAQQTGTPENVYERVLRSGVIRCGYIVSPPYVLKDPNTGQMSGAAYEIVEAMARDLNLRVEWAEETGWGSFNEGLNSNRYDLMCKPVCQSGEMARIALLTQPVFYNAMYAIVREQDNRFDGDVTLIDKPDVRVAVYDNDIGQSIRRKNFVHTQEVALPAMSDSAQGFLNVASNKADICFDNISNLKKFDTASENKLKLAANGQPIRVFGDVLAVKEGEFAFKDALDAVISSLRNSGELSAIVTKYTPDLIDGHANYVEPTTQTLH